MSKKKTRDQYPIFEGNRMLTSNNFHTVFKSELRDLSNIRRNIGVILIFGDIVEREG